MKRSHALTIKISLVVLVAIIIFGYGLFQARNLIRGPEISVTSPTDGDSQVSPIATVSGTTANITHISLDDRPIFVDKFGNFSQELLLQPGYNIIKLEAQDRFGRTTRKLIALNYAASSTDNIIQ